MSTKLTAEARAVFVRDRYATELSGCEIVEADKGRALCRMSVGDNHRNAMGGVMGGALFTLADLAVAVAMNIECLENIAWVSTESHIHYLHNTDGDGITAEATCLHQGQRSCLYHVDIREEKPEGRLLAVVETSGYNTATKR